MIIPWGTDAPLYYRPFATIGMLALNVVLYFVVPADAYSDYVLVIGDGVHPIQWLTNNFLHAGIFHLVGNMIFLGTFGLVVEGKLGWLRFLAIYLVLGGVESAGMQLLVPSEHEVSVLGSLTILFGLMGMCLVWAPRNEVTCLLWIRFTPIEFDLSILWFAVMYTALDIFSGGLSGVVRASVTELLTAVIVAIELDHTIGAILGVLLGMAMLKLGWVDCENWDLFAVMEQRAGRPRGHDTGMRKAKKRRMSKLDPRGRSSSQKKPGKDGAVTASPVDHATALLAVLRRHIELGETEAALAVYRKTRRIATGWIPPEPEWRALIERLLEQQAWDDAILVMRDYVREQPSPSPRIRLKMAQILIQKMGRPQQALKLLGPIPDGTLTENLETLRHQLIRRATAMSEEGPLELDEDLV